MYIQAPGVYTQGQGSVRTQQEGGPLKAKERGQEKPNLPGTLIGPLEKEKATHSSILAWKISWIEEPGGLQPMGSQSWPQLKQLFMKQTNTPPGSAPQDGTLGL